MSKDTNIIKVGVDEQGEAVQLDVGRLIKTRALVTANSGGGKSWLLRLLFEQLGRSTQLIVLDREGEFVTLREKLDIVLVGPQGEIPTDVRSAALLCRRLMERQLSAVIDMSDLSLGLQRQYVNLFLTALIELPKELWRPCFVGLDETHLFCPEKGYGEAASTEAVINLATLGRKRGFCPIFATQRISKFHKDAAAELLNKFIGRTTLDVDQARAADELGIKRPEARTVLREMSPIGKEGEFFAFGPAMLTAGVTRLRAGKVQTTHPEAGQGRTLEPPKPSRAIASAVAELKDLPQQAEAEKRDVESLTAKVAELQRKLNAASPPPAKNAPDPQRIRDLTAQIRRDEQTIKRLRSGLEDAMKVVAEITSKGFDVAGVDRAQVQKAIEAATEQVVKLVDQKLSARNVEFERVKKEAGQLLAKLQKLINQDVTVQVDVKHNEPFTVSPPPRPPRPAPARSEIPAGDGSLSGPESRLLGALAWWASIGNDSPVNTAVAMVAGYSPTSTSYTNPRGSLRKRGLIDFPAKDCVSLTAEGAAVAPAPDGIGSREALHKAVKEVLAGPEQKLLQSLLNVYPDSLTNEALADLAGYSPTSTSYTNPRGKLRSVGLIEFPSKGNVAAADILFPPRLS